jgi:lambda repressor-like predicted transcriptional regulator
VTLKPTDSLAAIRRHLDELEQERPPLAKTRCLRDASREKAHCAFRAAVDALTEDGWSLRSIARHLECDTATLTDWYERGYQKRSQIPGWVLAALPAEARAAWLREALNWSEPPPGRTGTNG